MRIVLGLAYIGTTFSGWQVQLGVPTLQGVVEAALEKVAAHQVRVVCAGRTDRGVHAVEQVIHFDAHCDRTEQVWVRGCNYYLPEDIRVLWAKVTSAKFHARFSAITRTYQYLIYQGMMPWIKDRALIYNKYPLDSLAMKKSSHMLVGKHDFSAFRAASCQAKSPIRHVTQIKLWSRTSWIIIEITANAFLHHMVRNIVGVLLEIGRGKRSIEWVIDLLHSQNRNHGAVTAPPHGLYLHTIQYPSYFALPQFQKNCKSKAYDL